MSIHVCKCVHNGRVEYHLRYPGMTEIEAQALADKINGGGLSIPKERLAMNVQHHDCHKAADAFWAYWKEYGETHKHGYYESTWGAINRALRTVGVVEHEYMKAAADVIESARP